MDTLRADGLPLVSSMHSRRRGAAFGGEIRAREAPLAEEMPLNLVYGGLPFAVMMTTPSDLEDFIFGFSLTEGVIADRSDIRALSIAAEKRGAVASIELTGKALGRHLARRRSLGGRTGCGLCGIEDLSHLTAAAPVATAAPPSTRAIQRALGELRAHQPLHRITGAMHAAAWCDEDGRIRLAREDVGRHNALDKLIGACVRQDLAGKGGFVLITSRCSFEMVEKAAAFGAGAMVAISAPTSLAIERASALGMTLITKAGRHGGIVFSPDRLKVGAGVAAHDASRCDARPKVGDAGVSCGGLLHG